MLPTLWSLAVASQGRLPLRLLLLFSLGAFLMRSAGVILNDLADRRIDRHVERTKARPLASGAVGVGTALTVLGLLLLVSLGLVLTLNALTLWLSPIALVLAVLYPYSKRVFHVPQLVLGVAFGWGVVMAWAAVRNVLETPVWFLYAATVFWAVAYDTIYALQDRTDDRRIGIQSSAVLFGDFVWLAFSGSMFAMLICLGITAWLAHANIWTYSSLIGVALFTLCQAKVLREEVSASLAFRLFQQHVWAGWVILFGLLAGLL